MIRKLLILLFWIFIGLIIILYPILISIHVYLPLFIGFAGYMIVFGLEGHGMRYVWLPLLYLTNLESNLSMPIFMALLAVLLYYLTIYKKVNILKRCPICVGMLSVIFIDLYYVVLLLVYDFVFDTASVVMDTLLLYSLAYDMIFVVLI